MTLNTFNIMKRALFSLLALFAIVAISSAQVITEQFEYAPGSTLDSNGWTPHSGTTNPIMVGASSLTFPQYSPTAIGGSAVSFGNGQDVNKYFGPISSGSIYASFLLRVDTMVTSGYFFHFMDSASTSAYRARTYFQPDANNPNAFNFGLTFNSSTGVFDTTEFTIGDVILVVAKYTIIPGIGNDVVSLYAFDANASFLTEPTTPLLGPFTGTATDIDPARIAIRQFTSSNDIVLDAFSVSTTWNMMPTFTLAQIDLPIDWDNGNSVDYTVIDFGGNASMLAADPTNASNTVLKSEKTAGAQTWAGTTLGNTSLANAIPFAPGATSISAVVFSPDSGTVVRLKAEDHTNNTITVETEAITTVANGWDTLIFDFSNQVSGTAALNFANTYDMLSIFYAFGTAGSTPSKSYYLDDLFFGGSTGGGNTGSPSPYCNTQVFHFGNPAEVLSSVYLTMEKAGPNSFQVIVESATTDPVDDLIIPGGSGAAISAIDTPAVGQLRRILSWTTTPPDTINMNVLWSKGTFPGNWQLSTMNFDIAFDISCSSVPPQKAQIDLPITWNDTATVDYTVADFGGNASSLVADPLNASNIVLKSEKTTGAQIWAGTTLSTSSGLANPIPFVQGSTIISAVVFSPDSGTVVRLKAEDHTNNTISVETEAMTTMANGWDTLEFDFANQVSGTAAINFANTYDMLSIFYDFGNAGGSPAKSYYVDDVFFGGGSSGPMKAQIDLPITWNDTTNVDYTVADFGGNASSLVTDPANASNIVLKSEKTTGSQTWAGTTLSTAAGLATAIPFAQGATTISALVYSPDSGTVVRLKAEDAANASISVETEAMTTMANGWDTLVFDFANNVSGTAAINFANTYNKLSIFYDFGNAGASPAKSYYLDDVFFGGGSGGGPSKAQIDLPITWNDTANVDYTVADFGGNASSQATDPMNANNLILQSIKTSGAQTWAGTTLSTSAGLATAIPFAQGATTISCVVYAPASGIPVRLKAEDHLDPTKSVETEVLTSLANAWDTLVFDFANQASGTAPINFTYTYDKLSIFYDFGSAGAADTFYLDDVFFGGSSSGGPKNITFQVDMSQYAGTFTTPELNGTFNNWCGNCTPMSDPDGDNIWEVTVQILADSIEYKFSYDNWTGQESLAPGLPCTKTTSGFTNRFLVLTGDTTLPAVCWESCNTCGGAPTTANVTFQVDLSEYTGSYTQVNLNGTFNNWCGSCAVMTDANNDSIFEITIAIPANDTSEFKYTLDGWTVDEQLTPGDPCTKTTGGFTNRFIVPMADTTLPAVCWESCSACSGIGLAENGWSTELTLAPNPTNGLFNLNGNLIATSTIDIEVVDLQGNIIYKTQTEGFNLNQTIDLSSASTGMYMVRITTRFGFTSLKLVLTR